MLETEKSRNQADFISRGACTHAGVPGKHAVPAATSPTTARFFVTGTDTGVGKTVAATVLARGLGAQYWKPIQTGAATGEADADFAANWIGADHVIPCSYEFATPVSPHLAAASEGTRIELEPILARFSSLSEPLIVEGAGGVLVPINNQCLMIDLVRELALPAIVVSRTRLGTINHTLLTLEALRARGLAIRGVLFVGDANESSAQTIAELGQVPVLGRIPWTEIFTPSWFQETYLNLHLGDRIHATV